MDQIAIGEAEVAGLDRNGERGILREQFRRIRKADISQTKLSARVIVRLDVPELQLAGSLGYGHIDVDGHHPVHLLNLEVRLNWILHLREIIVWLEQERTDIVPVHGFAVTGWKIIEAGSTNSKARSKCVPECCYRIDRAGIQTLYSSFAREHFIQIHQSRLTVMRSANEIRLDAIFALTIARHSFRRRPEIRLDPTANIGRYKTTNEISGEISIQYFEDTTDVYAPGCLMYTERVAGQGRAGYARCKL